LIFLKNLLIEIFNPDFSLEDIIRIEPQLFLEHKNINDYLFLQRISDFPKVARR